MDYFIDVLLMLPAVLIGLVFHEFAHGLAADKLGDPTPRSYGRLTIEPWPHIDILGLIMIFIPPHIGWAKPVPIDPRNFRKPKRDEVIVSIAGPLMNLFIAIAFGFLLVASLKFGLIGALQAAQQGILVKIIQNIMVINIVLFVFNLIPIPPLDGSHIIANLLPYNQAQKYRSIERYGFIILIILVLTNVLSYILSRPIELIFGAIITIFSLLFGLI
ncbi:MAG: site-2 protease family protein [Deltaproteobacteria bacterium]